MGIFHAVASSAVVSALVLACGSSNNKGAAVPNTSTGVTAPQQSADMKVVDQIATARCRHEQTCNNVGPGRHYESMNTCLDQMRGGTADELNAYNCPRGISSPALNHCVSSIENAQCGNLWDQLATSSDCRSQDLCMQ
jgi:hypothetical protein